MSCKRRANATSECLEETSSDDERNDPDYDLVSSGGRSAPGRHDSVASNGSSEPRRRGRGVSKRPCLNRNAQMARENRQRKKEYLEKVENKLAFYRQENKSLSTVIQRQGIDLKRLNAEVSYLKNVLNNSSSITTLLRSMNDTLAGKNGNKKDRRRVENNLRARNDSGTSISGEKNDTETPISWNGDSSAAWRRGGKYGDRDAAAGNLKSQSLGDSDHTYTTSGDGSCDGKLLGSFDKDDGVFSKITGDRFIGDFTANSMNFGGEIDELPPFDADLFDSIGNEAGDNPEAGEYFRRDHDDDAASIPRSEEQPRPHRRMVSGME